MIYFIKNDILEEWKKVGWAQFRFRWKLKKIIKRVNEEIVSLIYHFRSNFTFLLLFVGVNIGVGFLRVEIFHSFIGVVPALLSYITGIGGIFIAAVSFILTQYIKTTKENLLAESSQLESIKTSGVSEIFAKILDDSRLSDSDLEIIYYSLAASMVFDQQTYEEYKLTLKSVSPKRLWGISSAAFWSRLYYIQQGRILLKKNNLVDDKLKVFSSIPSNVYIKNPMSSVVYSAPFLLGRALRRLLFYIIITLVFLLGCFIFKDNINYMLWNFVRFPLLNLLFISVFLTVKYIYDFIGLLNFNDRNSEYRPPWYEPDSYGENYMAG